MAGGVFPVAGGTPDLSTLNMIPTLFSKKIIRYLYPLTCLSYITNTDYAGEIQKYGDKLIMRTLPGVNIFNYVAGQKLVRDVLIPGSVELDINKGKYWNFPIDDVQRFQSDIDYANKWAVHAAELLKIAIETDVFSTIYAQCDSTNQGATAGAKTGLYNLGTIGAPLVVTSTNAVQVLSDCMSCLAENNVPQNENDLYFVLPVWFMNRLHASDLKAAFLTGDAKSILRDAIQYSGNIAGARVFMSNLLPTGTDSGHNVTNILFGHKYAIGFATQITERDIIIDPDSFAKLMRGLQVYGFVGQKPTAFGTAYVTPA